MATTDELMGVLREHGWALDASGRYVRGKCSVMIMGHRVFFQDGDPATDSDDTAATVGGTIPVDRAIEWVRSKSR